MASQTLFSRFHLGNISKNASRLKKLQFNTNFSLPLSNQNFYFHLKRKLSWNYSLKPQSSFSPSFCRLASSHLATTQTFNSLFISRNIHSSKFLLDDDDDLEKMMEPNKENEEPEMIEIGEDEEEILEEFNSYSKETFEDDAVYEDEFEEVEEEPVLSKNTVYSESDEIEAAELSKEIKQFFAGFEGKSKQEIQKIFNEKFFEFEKLFQRVSLNPLLSRQLREMEREIYTRAKSGETSAIQTLEEADQFEKAIDSFEPDTIYILQVFLPRVFKVYEKEQAKKKGIPEKNYAGNLERLVLREGLIPPTLRQTINDMFYPNQNPDYDLFAQLIARFREEIPSVRTEFRSKLKNFTTNEFTKFYNTMRTKLEIIESEAIAMDKERNTKKEEIHKEEWILNNPTDFDSSSIGKYISIDSNNLIRLFPEGLGETPLQEFSRTDETYFGVMVREESLKLIESLRKALSGGFLKQTIPRFQILSGEKGCGKTSILNLVTYWARSNGWIVVRINARNYTFDAGYVLAPSTVLNGFWDNNMDSFLLCKQLLSAHGEQLKTLPIRNNFEIPGFNRTSRSTLADLLEFGTNSEEGVGEPGFAEVIDESENVRDGESYANAVIYYFRRELTYITKYPILIIVDEINSFFNKSANIYEPESVLRSFRGEKILPFDRLTTPHIFGNFKNHGLINGTVIGALTGSEPHEEFLRRNNLRNQDLTFVRNLQGDEFNTILNWYTKSGVFGKPLSKRNFQYLNILTGGRGHDLLHFAKAN